MKIICINNSFLINRPPSGDLLTVGNIYEVIRKEVDVYFIIDNSGNEGFYHNDRFRPYYREDNLKKLGID